MKSTYTLLPRNYKSLLTIALIAALGSHFELKAETVQDPLIPGNFQSAPIGNSLIACASPLFGWKAKLHGTFANDGAGAIHADVSECAVYLGGDTWGDIEGSSGNAGFNDAFVTRYNTSGTIAWTRQFGTSGYEGVEGLATDSNGNLFVVGSTTGQLPGSPETNQGLNDAYIAKYNSSGDLLWVHQLGSTGDDYARSVVVNSNNEIIIAGVAGGILPGNGVIYSGGKDMFIAKYDTFGNRLFTRLYGTPADDEANAVAVGSADNIYVTGYTEDDMPYYNDTSFNPDYWHGADDIFVGKYDADTGNQIWIRQRGSSLDDRAYGMAVNDRNQVFVTGMTEYSLDGGQIHGLDDIVTLRYDANGSWVWTDQRGSMGNDRGAAVAVDSKGRPFVSGYAYGEVDNQLHEGEADAVLIKYGRGGDHKWTREFGTDGPDRYASVTVGLNDSIFAAGFTTESLYDIPGFGANDAFSIKYDQDGVVR